MKGACPGLFRWVNVGTEQKILYVLSLDFWCVTLIKYNVQTACHVKSDLL